MEPLDEIIKELYSKEDLDLLYQEVDELVAGLYERKGQTFDFILQEKVRAKVADKLTDIINKSGIDKKDLLTKLKEELEKVKVMKLTLAFEPTYAGLKRIANWVKQNISYYVVVDIVYDRELVGGAVIEYRGNYHDYSLKKTFDKSFEEKKQNIINILRSSPSQNEG